ncbi:MAG TPA: hypothetical protein PLK76_03355 [bacterium]|nr:hypothetical protein [bacterium]
MNEPVFHTLRCLKCACHFSNILKVEGMVKIEKKCPKCKCLNTINLTSKEITIKCKLEPENIDNSGENSFIGEREEY